MMSWIREKSSCTYFERSRVPSLKVGYLVLVEILTSLAKKKKENLQGENAHQCGNSLDASACNCFSRCKKSNLKAKRFFAVH